ncbi:MAG TPA: hypothetical protein VFE58_15090 [Tepidisphaeraceae bacterium]|jgi:hypothetical protein|nr:hypothetical protein [Tepidisphaeraceae bacterium]
MPKQTTPILLAALSLLSFDHRCHAASSTPTTAPSSQFWRFEELKRFPAPEATQGVAADNNFFYAIGTRSLGKYNKETGQRVAAWTSPDGSSFKHLNAGIVLNGLLYCAHSNFPNQPPASSVEIWDTNTMQHVATHSFGRFEGSLTWIDRFHDNHWIACFAHYAKEGSQPGNPALTQVVEFDSEWRQVGGWIFPEKLITQFASHSASGGAFGPHGFLFVTGHDAQELYVLSIPDAGPILQWRDTIPITAQGQSFAWDPVQPGIFYSVSRKTHEVIQSRISLISPEKK